MAKLSDPDPDMSDRRSGLRKVPLVVRMASILKKQVEICHSSCARTIKKTS